MRKTSIILSIIIFGLLLIFQSSHAEVYKWVDEKGTVNFTEDPETIPEKYKPTLKRRKTEEDLMSPEEKGMARERYKQEKREDNIKEFERKTNELEKINKKEKGKCELIYYAQYDNCVNIRIKNNDQKLKKISEENIVARTSDEIITKWRSDIKGEKVPAEKKDKFYPKAFFLEIRPGETYNGYICFDLRFPIKTLELWGL